jgi:hypothetical protein
VLSENNKTEILKNISNAAIALTKEECGNFTKHDALHDCIYQAYKAKIMLPNITWINIANNIHKRKSNAKD